MQLATKKGLRRPRRVKEAIGMASAVTSADFEVTRCGSSYLFWGNEFFLHFEFGCDLSILGCSSLLLKCRQPKWQTHILVKLDNFLHFRSNVHHNCWFLCNVALEEPACRAVIWKIDVITCKVLASNLLPILLMDFRLQAATLGKWW